MVDLITQISVGDKTSLSESAAQSGVHLCEALQGLLEGGAQWRRNLPFGKLNILTRDVESAP